MGKSPPKVSKSPPKVCERDVGCPKRGARKRKKREGAPAKEIHKERGRPRTQRVRPELVRKTEPQTEGTAGAEHRGYGRSQMSHQRAHLRHAKRLRANHSHKRRLWTLWRKCGMGAKRTSKHERILLLQRGMDPGATGRFKQQRRPGSVLPSANSRLNHGGND